MLLQGAASRGKENNAPDAAASGGPRVKGRTRSGRAVIAKDKDSSSLPYWEKKKLLAAANEEEEEERPQGKPKRKANDKGSKYTDLTADEMVDAVCRSGGESSSGEESSESEAEDSSEGASESEAEDSSEEGSKGESGDSSEGEDDEGSDTSSSDWDTE